MPSAEDPFAALGVATGASEADIRAAYRKLSLKLHPDKARDVPPEVAAARFHAIQTAYEALQDPAFRAKASASAEAERKKKERQGAYDGKRKQMAEELEREEKEGSKKRKDLKDQEEKLRRLKEEGRRLTEQRLRTEASTSTPSTPQASAALSQASPGSDFTAARSHVASEPPLGPLDKTVRVRYPADQASLLAGPSTNQASTEPLGTPLATALSRRFGPVEALRFLPQKASKRHPEKNSKESSALVSFTELDHAMRAVELGGKMNAVDTGDEETRILEDVHIEWASAGKGVDGEPAAARFRRLRREEEASSQAARDDGEPLQRKESLPGSESQDSADAAAYEADTLARLMSMS